MIEHGVGNLLQAEVEALVNPVNCDGVMGKGLALQFKKMFPKVFRAYRTACQRGEVTIGRMHVVERATALALSSISQRRIRGVSPPPLNTFRPACAIWWLKSLRATFS
jgi:O-acetyl-ADP-ribose deacetylase (regulator of RNase III)